VKGFDRAGRGAFVRGFTSKFFPMNKAELVDEVRRILGNETSIAGAERAVEAVLGAIGRGLRRDKEVQLVGFGAFAVATRAARRGFNPHTKQPMKIRAMKTIRFKAGQALRALA
jgi:DNA-binding protein HU-beta